MASAQYGKTGRVERRKQKNRRLLLPKQLLESALLQCLEAHGCSDSAIRDFSVALSTSSILLRPTDGGKSLEVRGLAVQRFMHTTSFLDDAGDELLDEESMDVAVLRCVPAVEDAFEDETTSSFPLSKARPRAKSGTTLSTLSCTPRRNYLGNLIALLSPPANEEFVRMSLDSGCDVNLMAARMLPLLNLKEGDIKDCLLEMKTLKGIMESQQCVQVSFEFPGWETKYKTWFFILPDNYMSYEAILGHKCLNAYHLYPKDGILPDVMAAQAAALHRVDQGVSINPSSPQLHG